MAWRLESAGCDVGNREKSVGLGGLVGVSVERMPLFQLVKKQESGACITA